MRRLPAACPSAPALGLFTLLAAVAAAPAGAQGSPVAPSLTLAVGRVGGGLAAAGATTVSTPGTSGPFPLDARVRNSAELRLAGRPAVALDAVVPVGRTRWAVVADLARGAGRGTLVQRNALSTGGDFSTLGERTSEYARVVAWTGSLGLARVLALGGAWAADLRAAGVVGRVRAAGDGPCPPVPPSQGFIPPCLRRPDVALTAPGARLGGALYSPAWHGVRLRVLVAEEVLWTNGTALAAGDEGPPPAGSTREQTGRATRRFTSAGLGVAVALRR